MRVLKTLVRLAVFVAIAATGLAAGWILFVAYPDSTRELLGVFLVVILAPVAVRTAGTIAAGIAPNYNVAEVSVSGPITRQGGGDPLSRGATGAGADAIVEQIDRANSDRSVDALLVRLNTPGGAIVPSEDIKLAVERFEGPTVAYATDTCASGGYEIASGCDEIWAREGSIVGSIGVIGSRITAADLADRLGIQYEQLTAGRYKDAGTPLKELEDDEREYLQGIVDDYYDYFVENVSQRRDLDEGVVRDTEARVYLGEHAKEKGLVDEIGTRSDVRDSLEDELGAQTVVEEFEPQYGLADRLSTGTRRVAYAFGTGIASVFSDENRPFKLR